MEIVILVLVLWIVFSFPISLLVGRFLAGSTTPRKITPQPFERLEEVEADYVFS